MPRSLFWLCVPASLILLIPFVTLAQETPWLHFSINGGDGEAIRTSLLLGAASMTLIVGLGTPWALWLAKTQSPLKRASEALVLCSLLTPPLAMGILLVSSFGPYSVIGKPLADIGYLVSNNAPAFLLAQVYGGMAYFVMAARNAFEGVPREVEEAARTLGATEWQVFRHLTLPLAMPGIVTGLAITWVRVIGEFGIAVTFSYFPQGIPVRLYVNLQNDGVDAVYVLVWLLLISTLPFPLWIMTRKR